MIVRHKCMYAVCKGKCANTHLPLLHYHLTQVRHTFNPVASVDGVTASKMCEEWLKFVPQ